MNLRYPKYHSIKAGNINKCQICNYPKLNLILDLGHQPLCDTLLSEQTLNEPEKSYPLRMMWCENCTGVQLDYCVDGKEVFHPSYPYLSGISKPLVEYQRDIAHSLIKKYNLQHNDLVIDIGSGDGTLLKGFKEKNIRLLGIEPTNISDYANSNGIKTIKSFFDIKLSNTVKRKHGKAKVITTTNVFAHMQTIGEFVTGIHNLLTEDGVFISETHYLLDIIKDSQFDTIYHEHLRTYSLKSIIKLFEPYDFTVTDVERGDRYGGNIRVHVSKGRGKKVSNSVKELLKLENSKGLNKIETYKKFAKKVQAEKINFINFLIKSKKSGEKVVGKSCPGRASTLLNYYGVDKELLPYLAELPTSLKLNMYLPGKHIPVVDEKILKKEQPDYIVLLAWHYADFIMPRLKKAGIKSDFVVPLPKFRIVRNKNIK
ncbi:MAG: hypothetical protein QG644_436 [Patescibacteria group bacterium]|nr:hypothetical protein [Patescibacteria group bacterium]